MKNEEIIEDITKRIQEMEQKESDVLRNMMGRNDEYQLGKVNGLNEILGFLRSYKYYNRHLEKYE